MYCPRLLRIPHSIETKPSGLFFQPAAAVFLAFLLLNGCTTATRNYNQFYSVDPQMDDSSQQQEKSVKFEDRTADELLSRGYQYLFNGNYQLAQLHFVSALQKDPNLADAYAGLGETFLARSENRQASAAFSAALEKDHDNRRSLFGLGRLYRLSGQYDLAEEYLKRAGKLLENDPPLMTELAMTYDATNRLKEAETLYLKVVSADQNNASAYNNLGFNYFLQGEYPRAIEAYDRSLEIRPDKRVQNNLAAAYAMQGQEDVALHLMQKTIGKAGAYNNLGYVYMSQGLYDKAELALNKAIELNPSLYQRAKDNLWLLRRKQMEENFIPAKGSP
jgi:tetratricopeptide (TPR) repeat protein